MSNNQWNTGQGDGQWQPQGGQDWNQAPQPQTSADWNQPPQPQTSADWNQAPQPQTSADWNQPPQQPAQDWNQAPQQDWGQAPQQPAGQDWGQAPQQDWGQQQPAAQDWNQQQWNQQQAGGFAPGQQWQPAPPKASDNAFGAVFDFSFKKLALPKAAGTIYVVAVICIALWWLFDLVGTLSLTNLGASYTLQGIVGGLARSVLYILLVRVFLEGAVALVKLSEAREEEPKTEE